MTAELEQHIKQELANIGIGPGSYIEGDAQITQIAKIITTKLEITGNFVVEQLITNSLATAQVKLTDEQFKRLLDKIDYWCIFRRFYTKKCFRATHRCDDFWLITSQRIGIT